MHSSLKIVGSCFLSSLWARVADDWPVEFLILGDETYFQPALLTLFGLPPAGDASLILAHQLIAAKLNVANGADDSDIDETIDDADELLAQFGGDLPYEVDPDSADGQEMVALADDLAEFNEGATGPGHCEEETVTVFMRFQRWVASSWF